MNRRNKTMLLLHIAKKDVWKQNLNNGLYGDFSIEKDGFIHCSEFNQLLHVANNNLKNVNDDLVVLCIDASRLKSEVKWETNKINGMIFPHVYGLINIDSVIDIVGFRKNQDEERKHLTYCTRLKRLAWKTIYFSKSSVIHNSIPPHLSYFF